MNNFNQICPSGNHMAAGNPADEYNARKDNESEKFKCAICNEHFEEDQVVETKGDILCLDCRDKEKKEGEL